MRYVLGAVLALGWGAAAAQSTFRPGDLALMPDHVGRLTISSILVEGETTSAPKGPLIATYEFVKNVSRGPGRDAELQCTRGDHAGFMCSGHGEKKTIIAGQPACFTPPSKNESATVYWFADGWDCSLDFKLDMGTSNIKRARELTEEVALFIRSAQTGKLTDEEKRTHGAAIEAAHKAALRRR